MNQQCSVKGCDKGQHARGYCSAHYHRLRRYGDPLGSRPMSADLMPNNTKNRVLLAKSCSRCCCFQQASGYYLWRGRWSSLCKSCTQAVSVETCKPETRLKHRKAEDLSRHFVNEHLRETASNWGQPYTGADMEILLREDLTSKEKAEMMHRTLYGVKNMLKSHRKGEATPRRLTEGHPLTPHS